MVAVASPSSLSFEIDGSTWDESDECSSELAGLVPTTRRITSNATSSQIVTLRAGKRWSPTNASTRAANAGGGTSSIGGSL